MLLRKVTCFYEAMQQAVPQAASSLVPLLHCIPTRSHLPCLHAKQGISTVYSDFQKDAKATLLVAACITQ